MIKDYFDELYDETYEDFKREFGDKEDSDESWVDEFQKEYVDYLKENNKEGFDYFKELDKDFYKTKGE